MAESTKKIRNIEVKTRLSKAQYDLVLSLLQRYSDTPQEILEQHDIFFKVVEGSTYRFKMRIFGPDSERIKTEKWLVHAPRVELIAYDRPSESSAPMESNGILVQTDHPHEMYKMLEATNGVYGELKKTRKLFFKGHTRIHLDTIDPGSRWDNSISYLFLELEVVLQPDETPEQGRATIDTIMSDLGIGSNPLIDRPYVDLVPYAK